MPEVFDSRLNLRGPPSKWVQVLTLSPDDTALIKAKFNDAPIITPGWIDPAAEAIEFELKPSDTGFALRVYDGPSGSGYLTLDRTTITVGRGTSTRAILDTDDFWASKLTVERRGKRLFVVSTLDTRIQPNIKRNSRVQAARAVQTYVTPLTSVPALTAQDERELAFGMAVGTMLAPHVRAALAQRLAALSPLT